MADAAAHATITLAQSNQAVGGPRGRAKFDVPAFPKPTPDRLRSCSTHRAGAGDRDHRRLRPVRHHRRRLDLDVAPASMSPVTARPPSPGSAGPGRRRGEPDRSLQRAEVHLAVGDAPGQPDDVLGARWNARILTSPAGAVRGERPPRALAYVGLCTDMSLSGPQRPGVNGAPEPRSSGVIIRARRRFGSAPAVRRASARA